MPDSNEVIKVPSVKTLNIIYTNDIQGEAQQMAYMATKIKEVRNNQDYNLLVDSGNWSKGTMLSDRFKGMPMVDIFNALNYEAVNIGEGEMAFGNKNLYALQEKANFPMLSCNIIEDNTGITPYFLKKYIDIEKGPFKINVLGIASPDDYKGTGFKIEEPFKVLPAILEEIKIKKPDLIILLSRLGIEGDKNLAKAFPQINVIIGRNDGTSWEEPIKEGDTFICQAGEKAKYLGSLSIDLETAITITSSKK